MSRIAYTGYIVRDSKSRQYLNNESPRGGRWGRFDESSVYQKQNDALRTAFRINLDTGFDRAAVVPITLFGRR